MIKALIKNPNNPKQTLVLGLSETNVENMKKGHPVLVKLQSIHKDLPDVDIVIMYGKTEADIEQELKAGITDKTTIIDERFKAN